LLFSAEDHGESPIFLQLVSPESPKLDELKPANIHADDLVISPDALFFTRMSISSPNEIWRLARGNAHSEPTQVTHMNDALLSQIDMQPLESFTFKGANDEEVQGFILKPPGFDPNKKYPLKFLIHGGPQGAWEDSWTYRWNAELFAATGN
jgi:dipeptidyl aminopeptidase/acylaminoacyl peptidase